MMRLPPSLLLLLILFTALTSSHSSKGNISPVLSYRVTSGHIEETQRWDQPYHIARLRHSRHLERSTNGQNLKLAVKDNHKPVFTNCSNYKPSVKEEQKLGTHVITVKAVDRDPAENGGLVKYQLVSASGEKQKFEIDVDTGVITTAYKFDRDEPSREKEAYITVRASDNGHPQLDDVCTIKVTIDDINDNPPQFDKVSYSESVPQDLKVGFEVMRISATDIDDGNNSRVIYSLDSNDPDRSYFYIDPDSGVITLNKTIDKPPGYKFKQGAIVQDMGEEPSTTTISLDIQVVESNKKSPSFIQCPQAPIVLKENYDDYNAHIVTLKAVSNIENENELQYVMVSGQTEQTNKLNSFVSDTSGDSFYILLAKQLDYEKITEYTLNVRVQNKFNLATECIINIKIEDVNDNIPVFTEVRSGIVSENEPPGTPVMQVKAIDLDGTDANNQVTYDLSDHNDLFDIDPFTGNITTKISFDREDKDFYNIKVNATDNSPSTLRPGQHNSGLQVFRIEIADKNDNKPHFTQDTYIASDIPENANENAMVTQVIAKDNDTASEVKYSIIDGNIGDAFFIETLTGKIKVQGKLDYEKLTKYKLTVRAFDGNYEDHANVIINLENINDNPPIFTNNYTQTIVEETLFEGCIVNIKAIDPDIPDNNTDQKIVYSILKEEHRKLMSIDKNGCLTLIKVLDRDPPLGSPTLQVFVTAEDENGAPSSLKENTEVIINVTDINDNAPFLANIQPVIWYENQGPGEIVSLTANDNDSKENGAPFYFELADIASQDIRDKFWINGTTLWARKRFDREEIKEYFLPIAITDSGIPKMTGTSTLHVVIGDRNDNPMSEGHSSIFVYNFRMDSIMNEVFVHNNWMYGYSGVPHMEIGRVFVEDKDDWDLPDKNFTWLPSYNEKNPQFDVNPNTGMITMEQDTPEDTYLLRFNVTEVNLPKIPFHWVEATVNVTVKSIPEEAVDKSGSIRFVNATAQDFITVRHNGLSKKDILQQQLSTILNTSLDNVDVMTIYNITINNVQYMDVRFSAHGSPYYLPEKINSLATENQDNLEELLGLKIYMINIDECLLEKVHCEDSCKNVLIKSNAPLPVYTNRTSFVGVNALISTECRWETPDSLICYNGGTPISDRCECPLGYFGPHCEETSVGFHGDGWALYPAPKVCAEAKISLTIAPVRDKGLIFYTGPLRYNALLPVQDFMSLELSNGYPVLLVNYGSGTTKLEHKHSRVVDGKPHLIEILLAKNSIEMQVDRCKLSSCMNLAAPNGTNELLNINGPFQVGGANVNLGQIGRQYSWIHIPTQIGFDGCISNLTFNDTTYNLGMPSDALNADAGCRNGMAKAVSFGIDTSFLITILVCIAVLLILLLAVVVHKRRSEGWSEKELDDIRENIINYEDEGGGEGDAGYDLHVLRQMYDPPEKERDLLHNQAPSMNGLVPDISGFLDDKKHVIDRDPDTNPFDDVRHYAYEGDGDTSGSLSSLASCTDEGDLKFNYLSSFGPRFRKLADMYGEVPSDEDESQAPGEESWC